MPELSIIIISHSHGHLLIELLNSLEQQPPEPAFEIHLILNRAEDKKIIAALESTKLNLRISQRENPQSLSSNLNNAVSKIQTPYTLILNPDTSLPRGNLARTLSYLKNSDLELVTCRAKSPRGEDLVNLRHFPSPFSLFYERVFSEASRKSMQENIISGKSGKPFWIQGSYWLGRTSLFQKNEFDERYPLYFEDVDFCRRLWIAKKRLGICEETHFIHHFQRKSSFLFSKPFFLHLYSALLYFLKTRGSQIPIKEKSTSG